MNGDLVAAKKVLDSGCNCVLCLKGLVLTSKKEVINSLIEFLDSKMDFKEFASAARIITELEAIIYIKLGIKDIFTYKLNKNAKELFDKHNINCMYIDLTDDSKANINLDDDIDKIIENIKKTM